ncbi:sterol desaturase family protein [Rhodospirillum centenum]|uniref:Sterol desaturase family protein n=1 Tax=Rhodospirillum centenum (strain ATCC 51521 / SW) TaxID=414684 RepID=B6INK7_RHOCS|nr:sterol desaturase family protein [Rhodospirillum centenum]ACI99104.1 sterol desaturase family protein [Rhodospirillum centenum SW]
MRHLLAALLWPVLLTACIVGYGIGWAAGRPVLAFNLTYFGLAAVLLVLERLMPFERGWARSDGQIFNDIGHTALNKGIGQAIAASAALAGVAEAGPVEAGGFWPGGWPLAAQVALGLLVAEFGLYWAHRLAHEWPAAWRWHAVHHSVTRLWVVNTGRFHFLDSLWKTSFALVLALAVGAPKDVILWVLAITTYVGFMTHCNVDMRCGPLNWVFSTPELHRWHHSRDPAEGNRNYGENLILWDVVFGTRYLPDRRPPAGIGCDDPVPAGFLGQLAYPFRAWAGRTGAGRTEAARDGAD